MSKDTSFTYSYSAAENKEIQEIRKKYLPQSESRMDELKRLDGRVQSAGVTAALCTGIGSLLIFGLGMCLVMQTLGNGALFILAGIFTGIAGIAGMGAAYPLYRLLYNRAKKKAAPRILELTSELIDETAQTL